MFKSIYKPKASGRISGIFFILLAWLGLSPVAYSGDTLSSILSEKKITVGYIPYDELTHRDLATGKIEGFFPEILEAIVTEAGIKPENITYVATDWANFAVGLQAKKYDLSIAGTFKTIPRATAAAFTRPIFYLGNSAVIRKGDTRFKGIKDVMQLDRPDLTIAVVSGEQSHGFVKSFFRKAKIKVIKSADLTTALLEVASKRADVALSDHYVVKSYVSKHPEMADLFAKNPWNIQPIAWAVRSDDQELLNFLNSAIDYLESTGKLKEIMAKQQYATVPFLVRDAAVHPLD